MNLLKKILDTLIEKRIVRNQSDFAAKIGYNKGYISTVLSYENPIIPYKLVNKLQEVFNVNPEYIANNGCEQPMFLPNSPIVSEPATEYSRSTPPLEHMIERALDQQERLIEGQNKLIDLLTNMYNEKQQKQ